MYHFTAFRGLSVNIPFQYLGPDGTPIDMVGCTFDFDIYQNASRATKLFSSSNSETGIDYAADKVTLSMTPAQTSLLERGSYYYEVTVTWPDTNKTLLLNGNIEVK